MLRNITSPTASPAPPGVCLAITTYFSAVARARWTASCAATLKNLREAPIEKITVTDTIPLTPEKKIANIDVVSVAELLADGIKRIHFNQSISELFV